MCVEAIKKAGNENLQNGKPFDALWKYSHALIVCREWKLPKNTESAIVANCALACLNHKLYQDAYIFANECIKLNTDNSYKVQCRCICICNSMVWSEIRNKSYE